MALQALKHPRTAFPWKFGWWQVLHKTKDAIFATQVLKSFATLSADRLPVRIKVKISRVRYVVITPHTEL